MGRVHRVTRWNIPSLRSFVILTLKESATNAATDNKITIQDIHIVLKYVIDKCVTHLWEMKVWTVTASRIIQPYPPSGGSETNSYSILFPFIFPSRTWTSSPLDGFSVLAHTVSSDYQILVIWYCILDILLPIS